MKGGDRVQVETYKNVKGLEKFTIKCVFVGTEKDDENFIKDSAKIIVDNIRREQKKQTLSERK